MTASSGDPVATSGRGSPADGQGDIPADTFANRLRLARAHAGELSIREAADRCHLGRGAWTNWEKGARPQDLVDVAQTISDGLGINFNWLLLGGPLLPARGRLTKRTGRITAQYVGRSVRAIAARTNGRGRARVPRKGGRARRAVDRSQPVAA